MPGSFSERNDRGTDGTTSDASGGRRVPVQRQRLPTMPSDQPHELEQIPGIGPKRMEALREAGYESLADLSDASEEDLVAVEGIDDILARDIRATVSPRLRHHRKPQPPNAVTPEDWEITERQVAYLEEQSGERLREYVGEVAIDLVDELDWRVDPELLGFKKVCGRVVKRDSTGQEYPVPNATVHINDTDCNLLSYFPPSSRWGWFYPFGCHREEIATVTTDDCGRFCVYIPRWEIDRIRSFRRERICLPDIVDPRIRDLLEDLELLPEPPLVREPRPRPDPVPTRLREPGAHDQLTELLGAQTTDRLFALTSQSSFGESTRETDALLDEVVPTDALEPPLPSDLGDVVERGSEGLSELAALEQVEVERLAPRDFVGPFLRCRDVVVPVWKTIFDVPDITFEVTQDVDGDGTAESIYSEGLFDVRWNDLPNSEIVLEASDLALAAPQCDPNFETPDCEEPDLRLLGAMPLAPGYHSNGPPREGYAVRVNRPQDPSTPGPDPAATPYGGRLNFYGCGFRTEEAEYYRLVYRYRDGPDDAPTDPQPFADSDWHAVRENWPPATKHISPVDEDGWYEIPDPAVLTDRYQNLLLHWDSRRDAPSANGLYDVRLELADGSRSPLGEHSDWVTVWVDNTRPQATFDELEWRTTDGTESGTLPLSCPVIKRPIGADGTPKTIEVDVSYTVQHRHLRNLSLDAYGCGGGNPTRVDSNGDFEFWYADPDDTYYSVDDATFRVDGSLSAGAYTFELNAWSRAFNPTRATGGISSDWEINPSYLDKHRRLRVAIVDEA